MNKPDEMDEFERELLRAMRPVEPPSGFADRVQALAAVTPMPALRRWYPLAALLLFALATLLTGYHIERQRRAERQFDQAIRITDQALDQTRQQLTAAGIRLEP